MCKEYVRAGAGFRGGEFAQCECSPLFISRTQKEEEGKEGREGGRGGGRKHQTWWCTPLTQHGGWGGGGRQVSVS